MTQVNLKQTQMSALGDKVLEVTSMGTFATEALAIDFMSKRGYKFNKAVDAWLQGSATQFPVTIEPVPAGDIFDIRSFV